MNVKVLASTKVDYVLPKEEALLFSGKSAGICYLPDTVETLFGEPVEKTTKRYMSNIQSQHHSVFGHPTYTLLLEGIPKILAMILNNEKACNTSEKSARYTVMQPSEEEKELYEKWIDIFQKKIKEAYPEFDEKRVKKLALENARYFISVFTPATVMEYTVSFVQLNYIIYWCRDYIENQPDTPFSVKLKPALKEFAESLSSLAVDGLDTKLKDRHFSLFATRKRDEEFGENYSVNYMASFAELAQAQRHRTLSYEMTIPEEKQFYVPCLINGTDLEREWLNDMEKVAHLFPQGMAVAVNERGTIENFVLKCTERLCGAAQHEIMNITGITLGRYLRETVDRTHLHDYLVLYSKGPRCTFPGWKCNQPCIFGPKNAFTRKV